MQLIDSVKTFCITEHPANPADFKSNGKLIGSWCPYNKTLTSQKGKVYNLSGFLSAPKEIKSKTLDIGGSSVSVAAHPLIAEDGRSYNYHNLMSIYEDSISCLKTEIGDNELQKNYSKRIEASLFAIQNLRRALKEGLKNCASEDDDAICEIKL